MPNLTGQSIGRYHILEQLGEGGMAIVYKAYDTRLERNVALKVLRTDLFGSAIIEQILKRFEREAKSLAKLKHSNIVNILDFGEHEGMPYLVMEYLPGGTLKQKLGHAIPWQEAIQILLPVARGLAYAHQHGVIHRDVKPANVLIDQNEEPILTDFGIAKLLEGANGHTLTASGVGIGTPEYMAPEQGIGAHTIDARADVYSLGIVLYEMVTGRKPYIADTPMAVVLKQMTDPLPRPTDFVPDLPEDVEHILFKALAKKPDDRYADMNALIAAMEDVLAEKQKFEAPLSTKTAKKKAEPSPKVVRAVIGTLAIGLIIVFGTPWIKQQFSWTSETTSTVKLIAPATSTFTLLPPSATLEFSPTPTRTRTPRPTATNTPIPAWVTDFAEPILSAIADQPPKFQDDFDDNSGGWHSEVWLPSKLEFIDGELILNNCRLERNKMDYNNFVLKLDLRFLSKTDDSAFYIWYRNYYSYYVWYHGDVTLSRSSPSTLSAKSIIWESGRAVLHQNTTRHILIIAKGNRFAFYVDDQPIYYLEDTHYSTWGPVSFGIHPSYAKVAIDNLKIWDLDKIPIR